MTDQDNAKIAFCYGFMNLATGENVAEYNPDEIAMPSEIADVLMSAATRVIYANPGINLSDAYKLGAEHARAVEYLLLNRN